MQAIVWKRRRTIGNSERVIKQYYSQIQTIDRGIKIAQRKFTQSARSHSATDSLYFIFSPKVRRTQTPIWSEYMSTFQLNAKINNLNKEIYNHFIKSKNLKQPFTISTDHSQLVDENDPQIFNSISDLRLSLEQIESHFDAKEAITLDFCFEE